MHRKSVFFNNKVIVNYMVQIICHNYNKERDQYSSVLQNIELTTYLIRTITSYTFFWFDLNGMFRYQSRSRLCVGVLT